MSFIAADGVAQGTKKRVDLGAVTLTTEEDLQIHLKGSMQYHPMSAAVHPEQLPHVKSPLCKVLKVALMIQMKKA